MASSSSPSSISFNKSRCRHNMRRKGTGIIAAAAAATAAGDDDDDDDDNHSTSIAATSTRKKGSKKSSTAATCSSLLSFHDDDDDVDGEEGAEATMAAVAKFRKNKKLGKARIAMPLPTIGADNDVDDALAAVTTQCSAIGEYSADNLAKLRQGQLTTMSSSMTAPPPPSSFVVDDDDDVDDRKGQHQKQQTVVIPDANEILAAKRMREQMREGYIPLNEGNLDSISATVDVSVSRHVREEDEGGCAEMEEPDGYIDSQRVSFRNHSRMSRSAHRAAIADYMEVDNDEDGTISHWEQEQVRKGMRSKQQLFNTNENKSETALLASYGLYGRVLAQESGALSSSVTTIPSFETINVDDMMIMLEGKLKDMEIRELEHKARVDQLQRERENIIASVASIDDTIALSTKRYSFFQQMRGYVTDLLDFLGEKLPAIQAAERAALDVFIQHPCGFDDKENLLCNIRVLADDIFRDVSEDFCALDFVRERFNQWRNEYSESYMSAYVSLCLPKLFVPFVRVEMTTWNPLWPVGGDFETSAWYAALYCYESNDDDNLVGSMVTRVVAPKLAELLRKAYAIDDIEQTMRAIAAVKQICSYSKARAVDDLSTLFTKAVFERYSEWCRGVDANANFVRNVVSWEAAGILLSEQAMTVVATAVDASYPLDLEKSEKIVNALPMNWFTNLQSTPPLFSRFAAALINLSNRIEHSSNNRSDFARLAVMLARVNEFKTSSHFDKLSKTIENNR